MQACFKVFYVWSAKKTDFVTKKWLFVGDDAFPLSHICWNHTLELLWNHLKAYLTTDTNKFKYYFAKPRILNKEPPNNNFLEK